MGHSVLSVSARRLISEKSANMVSLSIENGVNLSALRYERNRLGFQNRINILREQTMDGIQDGHIL